jgi:hypothetical protein
MSSGSSPIAMRYSEGNGDQLEIKPMVEDNDLNKKDTSQPSEEDITSWKVTNAQAMHSKSFGWP